MGVSHETWNKDDTEQRADFSTGLKVEKEKGLHQKPLKDFPMSSYFLLPIGVWQGTFYLGRSVKSADDFVVTLSPCTHYFGFLFLLQAVNPPFSTSLNPQWFTHRYPAPSMTLLLLLFCKSISTGNDHLP